MFHYDMMMIRGYYSRRVHLLLPLLLPPSSGVERGGRKMLTHKFKGSEKSRQCTGNCFIPPRSTERIRVCVKCGKRRVCQGHKSYLKQRQMEIGARNSYGKYEAMECLPLSQITTPDFGGDRNQTIFVRNPWSACCSLEFITYKCQRRYKSSQPKRFSIPKDTARTSFSAHSILSKRS